MAAFQSIAPKVLPEIPAVPAKVFPFWRISNISISQGSPTVNPGASIEFKRYRVLEDGTWEDDNSEPPQNLAIGDLYLAASTDPALLDLVGQVIAKAIALGATAGVIS